MNVYNPPRFGTVFLLSSFLPVLFYVSIASLPPSASIDIFLTQVVIYGLVFSILGFIANYCTTKPGTDFNAVEIDGVGKWSFRIGVYRSGIYGITSVILGMTTVILPGMQQDPELLRRVLIGKFARDKYLETATPWCAEVTSSTSFNDEVTSSDSSSWALFTGITCYTSKEDAVVNYQGEKKYKFVTTIDELRKSTDKSGQSTESIYVLNGREYSYRDDYLARKSYLIAGDLSNVLPVDSASGDREFLSGFTEAYNRWMLITIAAFVGIMLSDIYGFWGVPALYKNVLLLAHHALCSLPHIHVLFLNARGLFFFAILCAVGEMGTCCYNFAACDATSKWRLALYYYGMSLSNLVMWGSWLVFMWCNSLHFVVLQVGYSGGVFALVYLRQKAMLTFMKEYGGSSDSAKKKQ